MKLISLFIFITWLADAELKTTKGEGNHKATLFWTDYIGLKSNKFVTQVKYIYFYILHFLILC